MLEFFSHLNSLHPLSAEATTALMKVIRPKELRRGQVWLQEGAVCDKLTFIIKGLVKLYFEAGSKEVVLSIARENECILSAQSYFEQLSSSYSIRSVEQSVIVFILRNDLLHLVSKYPELNSHLKVIAHQQAIQHEYHSGLLMLAPRERFEKLATNCTGMIDGRRIRDRLLAGC